MLHVQCDTCGKWEVIAAGEDPDAAVVCGCCPHDHHHGQAANACTGAHEGDCAAATPGCAVCRPVTITLLPGTAAVGLGT